MHKHTGTGRDTDDTRGTGGLTRGGGICSTRIGAAAMPAEAAAGLSRAGWATAADHRPQLLSGRIPSLGRSRFVVRVNRRSIDRIMLRLKGY